MECGVRLGGVCVGRRGLVSWWVIHDPDAANPRLTGVPLDVLLVRPGVLGSILLDDILQDAEPALNPREHPIRPGSPSRYSLPSVPVEGKTIIS